MAVGNGHSQPAQSPAIRPETDQDDGVEDPVCRDAGRERPVATRRPAITTPPAKTTTRAPSAAGMMRTTGSDVFITVNDATVPCQSANVSADATTAVRTR